jgi:hypothetical protein
MNKLVLALLCCGCFVSLSLAESECGRSSGGRISDGRYVNERIGISFPIPRGLDAGDARPYPKDPTGHATAILLALWKIPREYAKPTLIIMSDDPFQYANSSAAAYVRRIANTVAEQHGKIVRSGRQYQLSGFAFYRLDYEFPEMSSKNLNIALTGRVGKCELSFQLNANSQDEIDRLFQSIISTTSIKSPAD